MTEKSTKLFYNSTENTLLLFKVFIIYLPLFNLIEFFVSFCFSEAEVENIPESQRHIIELRLGQTHFHK